MTDEPKPLSKRAQKLWKRIKEGRFYRPGHESTPNQRSN